MTPTVKGYDLQDKIGEGGFGAVYRAHQPSVGREVAIKIILPQYANHPDFIRRFETEAQLVARLEHLHIVPLYDYWREPDGAYLVMRYLRGGSLRDRIKASGSLRADTVVKLVDQISSALDLAHRNGVIHRDLKPSNILIDDEDNYYLTDFGIAKDLGNIAHLTAPSEVVITPAYASPEQVRREIVAPQTDIYAFGVVLFEALSGQHPFAGFSSGEIIAKHLNEALPSVRDLRPEIPEAIDLVIQNATAKDAHQRYRNAHEFAAAMRDAFDGGREVKGERTHTPVDLILPLTNPYKGLRPFDEADAADFFGRENLTEQLLNRLQEDGDYSRFLAVVGPSGSGKSSVVRAGLIPALRQGKIAGSENWYVAGMLPGSHPVEELEIALTHIAAAPDLNLIPTLQENERGLLRAVRKVLPTDAELTLIIDQFEEVFTLVDDPARARHFMDLIVAAVTDPCSPIRVIITLRADFYDRPLMIPDFSAMVSERTQVIIPMTPDELERAISTPAKRVGVKLEQGLTAAIIAEINEQPGALPMLQYALTELFECRDNRTLTLDCYNTIGGTLGALARRADEVFNGLNAEQQAASRQLFLRLVTLGEGIEDTRRRTLRSELVSAGGVVMDGVIDMLDQSRLLTFDRDPMTREPTVEVAHEAILREWGQLRNWLDESRHDIRQQRLLATAASDWRRADQDESYLLHGSRLEQFSGWANETEIALTEDEQNFLDTSVAVAARRQTQRRRIRNAVLVSAIVLSAVMSILALFALNARSEAETERDNADLARTNAEREALVNRSLALAGDAKEALLTFDNDLAVALALEAYTMVENPPPQVEETLFETLYAPGTSKVLRGHDGVVSCVDISPDGRYAVSGGGRPLAFEYNKAYQNGLVTYDIEDYSVRLWDLLTGEELHRFDGHTDMVWDVAFSPDGRTILSASADKTLILWDVSTGAQINRFEGHERPITGLAFGPDGTTALSSARQGRVIQWDVATGEPIRTSEEWPALEIGNWSVIAFSPDGEHAALASGTSNVTDITVWNLATGEVQFQAHPQYSIRTLEFSPDGQLLLSGGKMAVPDTFGLNDILSAAYIWDLNTGEEVGAFVQDGIEAVTGVAFSPDGRYVVTGTGSQHLMLWHVETGRLILTLSGHTDWITDVDFSADGRYLLSGSEDGTLRLWDTWNGAEQQHFPGNRSGILNLSFASDGQSILGSSQVRTPFLWDADTGIVIHQLWGHSGTTPASAFSPDGNTIITGSRDETLRLWDLATGEETQIIGVGRGVSYMALTADSRYVITAENQGNATTTAVGPNSHRLILFDLATGEPIRHFLGHGSFIYGIDISPDGQTVLSASLDETMRLWDIATGEQIRTYETPGGRVWRVAFSPDGRSFLGGGTDGQLSLWDVDSGEVIWHLEGHSSDVYGVDISPDGRYGLSVAHDNLMILWDLQTGDVLRRFKGLTWVIGSVAFSPDGQYAVSGDIIGNVILWRLFDKPDEIIAWAQDNRFIRELTCTERLRYNVTPLCSPEGIAPTRESYPTLTPSATPSVTPSMDITRITVTPSWTPLPSITPRPTNTPVPTLSPILMGELMFDQPVNANLQADRPAEWSFRGSANQTISIRFNAFGITLRLYDPEGNLLIESQDNNIGPIALPITGTYQVLIVADPRHGSYGLTVSEVTE